jgi:N-acyl-D-amino-acid deacylase
MEYDIILKNGRVIDGRGNPWYKGEVAIKDGFIKKVGTCISGSCAEEIDLKNNFICPGFIDAHSHSDYVFFVDSTAQSKVRQGVTTEVTGNCGMSGAPFISSVKYQNTASFNFHPFWNTIEEFIIALSKKPKTVNIAPLIGHGTLRATIVGLEDKEPTPEEFKKMEETLSAGLKVGAFGLSTGLYFAPGAFAKKPELVELARVVSRYGGVVTSHIRDEGIHTVGFLPSIEEIINVGREAGVPIQISHLKAFGPDVWGLSEKVVETIEKAREEGIDVTCDQYPYTASGGELPADILPLSFLNGKDINEIQRQLKDSKVIDRIKDEVAYNIKLRGGAENQTIANYPYDHDLEGRTLQEISNQWNKEPAEVALEMISNYYHASWVSNAMSSSDVDIFIKYPWTMICSDGSSLSTEGPLSEGNPHPRNFGAFPHVIREYVRDRKVLKLEDAIRKMTSLPAQRFSLFKRGCIEEGNWADIVVFDEKKITDATFKDPKQYPKGIFHVMVNGEWVIKNEKFTGNLPGRLVKKK